MKTAPVRQILAYLIQPEDTSNLSITSWSPPGGPRAPRRQFEMVKTVLWTVISLALAYGISQLSDAHPM
jgi:hypothetical protein